MYEKFTLFLWKKNRDADLFGVITVFLHPLPMPLFQFLCIMKPRYKAIKKNPTHLEEETFSESLYYLCYSH